MVKRRSIQRRAGALGIALVSVLLLGVTGAGLWNAGAPLSALAWQEPTRTLVPLTPTPTVAPSVPSPTPTDLPSPSSVSSGSTASGFQLLPPAAQAMIAQVRADLDATEAADAASIRLMSLEAFEWQDNAWGCRMRTEGAGDADALDEPVPGYRLVFAVENRVVVYHTDQDETFFVCEDEDWLAQLGEPLPADPIALSMVELARRDAARRLDVPDDALTLVSLIMLTWPDAAVGCPKPNADYADDATLGYRIVLRAPDDDELIYHTDIREVVFCTLAEEILPGSLQQAFPAPPGDEGDEDAE